MSIWWLFPAAWVGLMVYGLLYEWLRHRREAREGPWGQDGEAEAALEAGIGELEMYARTGDPLFMLSAESLFQLAAFGFEQDLGAQFRDVWKRTPMSPGDIIMVSGWPNTLGSRFLVSKIVPDADHNKPDQVHAHLLERTKWGWQGTAFRAFPIDRCKVVG